MKMMPQWSSAIIIFTPQHHQHHHLLQTTTHLHYGYIFRFLQQRLRCLHHLPHSLSPTSSRATLPTSTRKPQLLAASSRRASIDSLKLLNGAWIARYWLRRCAHTTLRHNLWSNIATCSACRGTQCITSDVRQNPYMKMRDCTRTS
jgi:hypothetical protein